MQASTTALRKSKSNRRQNGTFILAMGIIACVAGIVPLPPAVRIALDVTLPWLTRFPYPRRLLHTCTQSYGVHTRTNYRVPITQTDDISLRSQRFSSVAERLFFPQRGFLSSWGDERFIRVTGSPHNTVLTECV